MSLLVGCNSDPGRVDCERNEDCTNSCGYGAVNKTWLQSRPSDNCNDGCADVYSAPARCEAKSCVAYKDDGMRNDACTGRGPFDE